MSKPNNVDICRDAKIDCFGFGEFGRCKALDDTRFDKPCPFYKSARQCKFERMYAQAKLEMEGKYELLEKYEDCQRAL